jgi:hypothetical protein
VRELVERAYFRLCLTLGALLRSARYSRTLIEDDGRRVRKRRLFYAPFLVWLGGPLVRILNSGVRVLRQQEWEERERQMYQRLYGRSVRTETNEALVLPWLPGKTLAELLADPEMDPSARDKAIALAVVALAKLHALDFTHGDAMAENVLVDLEVGVAHWFDFETVHDSSRPMYWRCADDVRALLATCLLRTAPPQRAGTLRLILDVYGDERVLRFLAESFASVWQRPLAFHLGQAALSFPCFSQIRRLLRERLARPRLAQDEPGRVALMRGGMGIGAVRDGIGG